jgi:hypothetical protein
VSDPLWEQAGRLHASRLFKTQSAEHAYAVICCGQELGIGATTALANISVIQGKPSLGAALVGALIKRSGRYDYRVTQLTDQRAEVQFLQANRGGTEGEGWRPIGVSEFSLDDARRAGLGGSQTWKSYPRNLLLSRALTNGARWYTPDVFAGAIYDPSELESPQPAVSVAPAPDTTNGTGGGVTLEQLLDRYGADAIVAATGGGIPATVEEVTAVAAQLEAQQPGEPGAKVEAS